MKYLASFTLVVVLLGTTSCRPSESGEFENVGWAQTEQTASCVFAFENQQEHLLSGNVRRPLRETLETTIRSLANIFNHDEPFSISFSFRRSNDAISTGHETTLRVANGDNCIAQLRRVVRTYLQDQMDPCQLAEIGVEPVLPFKDFVRTIKDLILRLIVEGRTHDSALAAQVLSEMHEAEDKLQWQECSNIQLDQDSMHVLTTSMQRYADDADKQIIFLLDYDNTLKALHPVWQTAGPSDRLLNLLSALAQRSTETHVVSGRGKNNLNDWFASLSIGLHAEEGLLTSLIPRSGKSRQWTLDPRYATETMISIKQARDQYVLPIFEQALLDQELYVNGEPPAWEDPETARSYPAVAVEDKYITIALHFVAAEMLFESDLGFWADKWLERAETTINEHHLPLKVTAIAPAKRREVALDKTATGQDDLDVTKGQVLSRVIEPFDLSKPTAIVTAGDLPMDEALFEVAHQLEAQHPEITAYTIHVGTGALRDGSTTSAKYIVSTVEEMLRLLEDFVK
ncbi:MAG: hypothetical protein IPJ88_03635 [Myxococcales bacterium]|nr:MAG: hypothetical protein IPJ88_03635 [Myxococcales bacterium]